jgi:hypothetical protein
MPPSPRPKKPDVMNDQTLQKLTRIRKEYTGIGSRQTPPEVLRLMEKIGTTLARKGLILRSGAAEGADAAFEKGAVYAQGATEIYLPWKDFNKHPSKNAYPTSAAMAMAAKVHPAWGSCSQGAQKLHARNCHQVLGATLNVPSAFVIFYAPVKNGKVQGGTATAVELATQKGIPTFNLLTPEVMEEWRTYCDENS